MSTVSWGDVWGDVWSSGKEWLDYAVDDYFGLLDAPSGQNVSPTGDVWGNWAPEQTAPANDPPTEPGFVIGNNPQTWGVGLVAIGAAFLLYKAVK